MPSIASLIGTGIAFGCIHVLTGPDHLSALATLSANVGTCQAFSLGVRWGIGHSTGLIVVGGIMIALTVGIFMLFLGSIGMVRACRKRPSAASLQQTTSVDGVVQMDELPLTAGSTSGDDSIAPTLMGKGEASMSITDIRGVGGGTSRRSPTDLDSQASSFDSRHRGTVLGTACSRCIQKLSSKMLACFIGIVHGVAGPGGVLGVIPAVQLKDWRYSSIYLGSFCISSTVVMGCFAALYGTCSRKLGKDRGQRGEFIMECISASLSIIVGILWLTLLACGKLEDVFP